MWDSSADDLHDEDYRDDDNWLSDPDADELDLAACPACGAMIHAESEQCPQCGEYITFDTHPFAGKPTWWIVLGVLGVLALAGSLLLAF